MSQKPNDREKKTQSKSQLKPKKSIGENKRKKDSWDGKGRRRKFQVRIGLAHFTM